LLTSRHSGRAIIAAVILCMVAGAFSVPAEAAKRRTAGIVIDAESGKILYRHNIDAQIYPASLTKMMTLYMAFEAIDQGKLAMNQRLKVSRHAARQPRVKLGLKSGSTIRLKDAVMSMIVRSSNDSAVVIAEAIGRTEKRFAQMMTAKARELGMIRTTFRNANGLPNRRQKSTARDMATLGLALIRDFPHHYPLFSTKHFVWKGRKLRSTNKLLTGYPGVDGLKTGFINASGYNLAASSVRYGRRLVAVVIGGRTGNSRNAETQRILSKGFSRALAQKKAGQLAVAPLPPGNPDRPVTTGTALASLKLGIVSSANAAPLPPARPGKIVALSPYGVQVGAYRTQDDARNSARLAVRAVPTTLQNRPVMIEPIPNKSRPIYRARVIDLSQNEALRTCRALRQKRMDCLVVRTH